MPTTKSAKKRLRQTEKRRIRNRSVKASLRTAVRKVRDAVADKKIELADAELRISAKKLDQAAAKNIIHRNKAARLKSRLQRLIKSGKKAQATS
jgi:small subunit ribosomal protein S20